MIEIANIFGKKKKRVLTIVKLNNNIFGVYDKDELIYQSLFLSNIEIEFDIKFNDMEIIDLKIDTEVEKIVGEKK